MKQIRMVCASLVLAFCVPMSAQGAGATEFAVSLGKTVNGFNYSRRGELTYNGKRFSPTVTVNTKNITKFEISMLTQKKWAGAIAADVDGQNTLYFLDMATMTAKPMQKRGSWNAAQKIYWSPSQRYMVALCAYEGESFVRIDTKTRGVRDVGVSYAEPGSNYETMLRIVGEPRWSGSKDILAFNVNKYCNPYEGNCGDDNRNINRVLARYKISLDVATLKMTYGR